MPEIGLVVIGYTPSPDGVLVDGSYDVLNTCCGNEATINHRQLRRRIKEGRTRCAKCNATGGKRPWSYYPDGTHVGGLVILAMVERAAMQADTWYRIRYDCCSGEDLLTHKAISHREYCKRAYCAPCAFTASIATRVASRKERAALKREQPTREIWIPATAWPVPASLVFNRF